MNKPNDLRPEPGSHSSPCARFGAPPAEPTLFLGIAPSSAADAVKSCLLMGLRQAGGRG